jgi:hypothetical protein
VKFCAECGAVLTNEMGPCPRCGVSDPTQRASARRRVGTPYGQRSTQGWFFVVFVILPLLGLLVVLLF